MGREGRDYWEEQLSWRSIVLTLLLNFSMETGHIFPRNGVISFFFPERLTNLEFTIIPRIS